MWAIEFGEPEERRRTWRMVEGAQQGLFSQLVVGPLFHEHRILSQLAGHRIWMPGYVAGTEWAAYYDELAAEFGITIDTVGPNFGTEALLDAVADSPDLATFVGEQTRLLWPADYDLRRISLTGPEPVYPHSLLWRADNPHPALRAFRRWLGSQAAGRRGTGTWTPSWARRQAPPREPAADGPGASRRRR